MEYTTVFSFTNVRIILLDFLIEVSLKLTIIQFKYLNLINQLFFIILNQIRCHNINTTLSVGMFRKTIIRLIK